MGKLTFYKVNQLLTVFTSCDCEIFRLLAFFNLILYITSLTATCVVCVSSNATYRGHQ